MGETTLSANLAAFEARRAAIKDGLDDSLVNEELALACGLLIGAGAPHAAARVVTIARAAGICLGPWAM